MIYRSKIYIGYNKSNKRCLLYRLDENHYKDLEEKTIYTSDKLYLSSLVKYSDLVDTIEEKTITAKPFIKEYQLEENEEINLRDVFIGPICVIKKATFDGNGNLVYKQKIVNKNGLFLYMGFYYTNLFNNQEYDSYFCNVGDFRVPQQFTKPFITEMGLCETHLPKRKILQLYVDKYGVE